MAQYVYANEIYNNLNDVENAVVDMKTKLDSKPCEWCSVKSVTPIANEDAQTWLIGDLLNDDQLNNLPDDDGKYVISSSIKGDNDLGISKSFLLNRINEYRVFYSTYHLVNKYFVLEFDEELQEMQRNEHDVTNEDMNGYVE